MRLDRDKIPTIEQIRERFAPVLKDRGAKKAIVFDTERRFIKRADEFTGLRHRQAAWEATHPQLKDHTGTIRVLDRY